MNLDTFPLSRRLVLGTLAVLLAGGLAVGASGIMRVWEMQRELEALEHDIAQLRVETERLALAVEKLRNDPASIEQLARETLGLVRPGETVLKFPSSPPPPK